MLAWVTRLRAEVSGLARHHGVRHHQYIVATAAVAAAERKEAATKEADKQRLADLKRQYMEAKDCPPCRVPQGSEAEPKKDK